MASPSAFGFNNTQPAPAADFTAEGKPRRRANAGSFRPGPNPRRHKFTTAECSAGFWAAIAVLGVGIGQKLHKAGRWPNYRREPR